MAAGARLAFLFLAFTLISATPLFPAELPRNIILFIGDGMGPGAQKLASLYQHKADRRLAMQQLPVAAFCTTLSARSNVTDSAAASTVRSTTSWL